MLKDGRIIENGVVLQSVGIPEGAMFDTSEGYRSCDCQWVTLLCHPPIRKLSHKCDACKAYDGEPVESKPEPEPIDLSEVNLTGGEAGNVLAMTDKGAEFINPDND